MIVQAFILLLGMEAFSFARKFGLHIGHNNMMFQNYGSSVSCGVIRDIKLGAKYLLAITSQYKFI